MSDVTEMEGEPMRAGMRGGLRPLWACGLALGLLFGAGCDDDPTPGRVIDTGVGMEMGGPVEDVGVDPDMRILDQEVDQRLDPDDGVEPDMLAPDEGPPPEPNPCAPCEVDADCAPAGSSCALIGGGLFCALPCAEGECELGYTCVQFEDESEGCVPVRDSCSECEDADGDGYGIGPGCLGLDCNDGDPNINPGVSFDLCDGVDNDCDDVADEDFEAEACGIGACASTSRCEAGAVVPCSAGAPAANDATCDGVDDDCDGEIDEDYVPVACGIGLCLGQSACVDGVEQVCEPGAPPVVDDTTCDGIDDNCNGRVDEDFVGELCGVGACAQTGICRGGQVSCTPLPPLAEDDARCDGVDSDCDGLVDEDYTTDQFCGIGACRRQGGCVNGRYACTPGEPLSADDATPDGVDDNCNGRVDEDAQRNGLSLRMVERGADFMDVEVIYTQVSSPAVDPSGYQPRIIELVLNHPPVLALRQPALAGVVPGQVILDAEKSVNLVGREDNRFRVIFFSANNTNRIAPGVVCTLRFVFADGLPGPFDLTWDVDRSGFAPDESNDILTYESGSFGGP